jgi:DNA mismatch repair protein MutL
MPKIQKLSAHEAQKIAAGEVIERPANLLKELLENAIDAGSTKIAIHIKDAGKELVRVVDNGCGMSREDAELCFEQYATSKITHVDQLQEICTFGFRGEALASIAAVGKVTLITKEAHADEGIKIYIEQNSCMQKDVVSAMVGTDITVKDIFYNVPARRKFLKKRETEWHQIRHLFFAVCLAHLNIDFKLYSEDALVYACSSTSSLQERWQQLFDYQISKQMMRVEHQLGAMKFSGLISDHQVQRYDRSSIYLYVNSRWVNDSALTRAFIKGYQNVLQPGRYPIGCLFVEVDPKEVDINIHPRKEEVQFMHPRVIEREIQQCITKALEERLSSQLKKTVTIAQPESMPLPYSSARQSYASQSVHSDSFSPFNFDSFLRVPAFKDEMNAQESLSNVEISALQHLQTEQEPSFEQQEEQRTFSQKVVQQQYELIGQYKKTYLLLEQEDGLFVLDQHAAHERILYEQFVAQHTQITKVQLLFPQIISVSVEDMEIATAHVDLFSRYGIELEQFGADSLSVHATPVHLKNVDLTEIIKQALHDIRELQGLGTEQFEAAMQKKLYADMACKAAVKAGDTLSREQMQQLLCDLETVENRFLCPHGRPTSFLLHHDEIKKKFKRDYRGSGKH